MANFIRTRKIEPISSLDFNFWKRHEHSYTIARKIGEEKQGSIESVYSFETNKPIQLKLTGENTHEWFFPSELELIEKEDPIFLKIEDVLKNMDLEVRNIDPLIYQLSCMKGYYEDANTREHAINLIYGINRNHPLVNGNKRASLILGAGFLRSNGYDIGPAGNQDKTDFEKVLARLIIETASGKVDIQTLQNSLRPFIQKSHSEKNVFSLMEEYSGLYDILRKT